MLFNKEIDGEPIGNQEIHRILGFNSASLEFSKLETFIMMDKRRIKSLIGAIYDVAQTRYNHNDYAPELNSDNPLDQLVHHIQACHAFKGYLEFAKNNDLSHGSNGRRIMVGTDEKPAFEWMIEADNRALLRKAYDAMDALLFFLEEKAGIDGFTSWKDSEERKRLRGLIVANVAQFETVFSIDSSLRFFMLIRPFMADIERSTIRAIIGDARFEALITKLKNASALEASEAKIVELAAPVIVYYTLEQAMLKLANDELPETILKSYMTDIQNRREFEKLKSNQKKVFQCEGERLQLDLEAYIRQLDAVENNFSVLPLNDQDNKFFMA
jgi:hypothetical protein